MRHDAIVIGGGPAGATAALLLARAGWSVAVIEKTAFPRGKVCGEFLSATTVPLLRELGLADAFLEAAGPEIRRVAVFAGEQAVIADMPRLDTGDDGWGRALGREHLDTLLLDRAAASGATVWQPCSAIDVRGTSGAFVCAIRRNVEKTFELRAPIVIAAHGSWDAGSLSTLPARAAARSSDLFGFKARFTSSRLRPGLMPLLSFPGGYGGMVHTDHDRVSLSCCIRRDRLAQCRRELPGASAGDAVLAYIMRSCAHVRDALVPAALEPGNWRSAGPIRPGTRGTRRAGVFLIGNAAGEAHPVVAEGISMAMQSGWLLARRLIASSVVSGFPPSASLRRVSPKLECIDRATADCQIAAEYDRDWRRAFSWRIHAAAAIAHWAMRPAAVAVTLPVLRAFPLVLTEGARAAGKVSGLCSPSY